MTMNEGIQANIYEQQYIKSYAKYVHNAFDFRNQYVHNFVR